MIVYFLLLLIVTVLSHRQEKNSGSCDVSYKVYVYPIPVDLHKNAETARSSRSYHVCKKCIYEQFALEYIVYDYFTQFCGRTFDPDLADYFYLPIIRDIDYRIALQTGQRTPSIIESALLDVIEKKDTKAWLQVFNVTDKYWLRNGGADHILVMPAPVTNLRHQSNMRGFFHYMIQLNTPIFFNVEFSLSFAAEYPVCAYEKNLVMPYPTVDSDFYSERLFLPKYPVVKRDKLVFYQGGHHGSCDAVRAALVSIIKNKKLALYWGDKKREAGFQSAAFCPIPVGDSPSSKRMYDVMNFGCIPVVLSDDLLWAYTPYHPTSTMHTINITSTHDSMHINISQFSIHLPQNIVQKTATYMLGYNVKSERDMNFGWLLPSGTSLYQLLLEVAEEERVELLATTSSSTDNSTSGMTTHSSVGSNARRNRRLLGGINDAVLIGMESSFDLDLAYLHSNAAVKEEQLISSSILESTNGTITKRILVANNNKKPVIIAPGALSEGNINTLVRLLQKIPQSDIDTLQHAVMRIAPNYRYYEFNTSLPTDAPPMIAEHIFPSGGALRQLDRFLTNMKDKGIVSVSERCQVERLRPHKYIGRYPCEKRRMRRRRLDIDKTVNRHNHRISSSSSGETYVKREMYEDETELFCGER